MQHAGDHESSRQELLVILHAWTSRLDDEPQRIVDALFWTLPAAHQEVYKTRQELRAPCDGPADACCNAIEILSFILTTKDLELGPDAVRSARDILLYFLGRHSSGSHACIPDVFGDADADVLWSGHSWTARDAWNMMRSLPVWSATTIPVVDALSLLRLLARLLSPAQTWYAADTTGIALSDCCACIAIVVQCVSGADVHPPGMYDALGAICAEDAGLAVLARAGFNDFAPVLLQVAHFCLRSPHLPGSAVMRLVARFVRAGRWSIAAFMADGLEAFAWDLDEYAHQFLRTMFELLRHLRLRFHGETRWDDIARTVHARRLRVLPRYHPYAEVFEQFYADMDFDPSAEVVAGLEQEYRRDEAMQL